MCTFDGGAVYGAFVCSYNFISYVLLTASHSLTNTQVSLVFLLYLVGMMSSTLMERLRDRLGNGRMVLLSIVLMLVGTGISSIETLIGKLMWLALTEHVRVFRSTQCGVRMDGQT